MASDDIKISKKDGYRIAFFIVLLFTLYFSYTLGFIHVCKQNDGEPATINGIKRCINVTITEVDVTKTPMGDIIKSNAEKFNLSVNYNGTIK